MDFKNKKCILFAGVPGCSKTPTSIYLSQKVFLPIFNNDSIRSEVIEDLGEFREVEYIKKRNKRIDELIKAGSSFILDASVDREFEGIKKILEENNYTFFLISFDLSKHFTKKLWKAKKYEVFLDNADKWFIDHKKFLDNYGKMVNLSINDDNFSERLSISLKEVEKFLKN